MLPLKSALKSSASRLVAIFVVVVGVLLVNDVIVFRSLEALREQRSWVVHTKDMLVEIESLKGTLGQTQVSARGFVISDDVGFLSRYEDSLESARKQLESLKKRAADNPGQLELLNTLSGQVGEVATNLSETVSTYVARGRNASDPEVRRLVLRGRALMDGARTTLTSLRAEEERLLVERTAAATEGQKSADLSVFFALAFNFVLAIVAFVLLRRQLRAQESESWLRETQSNLSTLVSVEKAMDELAPKILEFLTPAVNAVASAFWIREADGLRLVAGLALPAERQGARLLMGEGLVGRSAKERRSTFLDAVPHDYFRLSSALGAAQPRTLACVPLVHAGFVQGVLEFASFEPFTELEQRMLENVQNIVAVALQSARSRAAERDLLEKTLTQQEELRQSNEELETQTRSLLQAQERLQTQQEELRQTNEELEQQAQALDLQRVLLSEKNDELRRSRDAIEEKVRELDQASRYKSEFLANMSHELRTPLNSLLILATLLKENRKGNLDEEDIEFANTIYGSGEDLLNLINDILDLAKVEAGRIEIISEPVSVAAVTSALEPQFGPVARKKGLDFQVVNALEDLASFPSDRHRVEQILKNFLSNAFKFTERGSITLTFQRVDDEVVMAVRDTGIGIPPEKQALVFEAFQQADGRTTRKYGGTGLGLTISRELAHLLGGRIEMSSVQGVGSEFRLHLPLAGPPGESEADRSVESPPPRVAPMADAGVEGVPWEPNPHRTMASNPGVGTPQERESRPSSARSVLVVEDDGRFRQTLVTVAKERGFDVIEAGDGETALRLLRERLPDAVLLDVNLPGVSGLGVLEKIKADPRTRHLPTHVISASDHSQSALRSGAMGYLVKPVRMEALREAFSRIESVLSKDVSRVLVVEDDDTQRNAVESLIAGHGIETVTASTGARALELLRSGTYDCMILDLKLPDTSGFELLETMELDDNASYPPVVVYTGRDLSREDEARLRRYSESIILKGAKSPERLLDEVSLFLHRVESDLSPDQRRLLQQVRSLDEGLEGRKVLIVDDDLRNTFALLAALEPKGLKVSVARNGREALRAIDKDPSIEIVLMDIMMPEMDGYEAMRLLRANPTHARLPIIALTAKAMKGDKEKCFEAGANDYLAKPIVLEDLLSLLRIWLPRRNGR